MQYGELIDFLQHVGKDPSRLVFEDELTGINNRRFLLSYLEHKVRWDGEDDFPLSLLIIDVDRFKQVNDAHGHDAGDQVLTWMATLLTEAAGDTGLPIRYGGDEFMVLLRNTEPAAARQVAENILAATAERPFKLRDSGTELPITLSIGIASAPQDATNTTSLMQTADTALYHAKRSGRNQVAAANDVDLEKVFAKAALYRLRSTGVFGRDEELSTVSLALEALTLNRSQFLVFEGSPGSGKTAILETIRSNLDDHDLFHVVKAGGAQQEAFRPYYLATAIMVDMLNQRDDKGAAILSALHPDEIGYLSLIIPQLESKGRLPANENDAYRREGIFKALVKFMSQAVEYRPLVLLIDDLHLADEATLLLLGAMVQRGEPRMLLCGASTESLRLGGEDEAAPLDRFLEPSCRDLDIRRVRLGPLTADDIATYLRGVFPVLKMPKGFEHDVVELTQGNPLFTTEIIRKLVRDQKVTLIGGEWTIAPLDDDYLPRSLEDSVMAEIQALDAAERQLLARASTLGEDVSLSMLTGASELDESRVFEFLDRAEALGLVQSRFELNDETMHFLGKRVLDISYGAIDEEKRQTLHEEVGSYQERLYRSGYVPSASLLAYHFKRSANEEKARRYEQLHVDYSRAVFDPDEAANYTASLDAVDVEEQLEPQTIRQHVPAFLRALVTGTRCVQLYPSESSAVVRSRIQLGEVLDRIFEHNTRLSLKLTNGGLLVNGQQLDVSDAKGPVESLLSLMERVQLQGLVFENRADDEELFALLEALAQAKPEDIDRRYWKTFTAARDLKHIELRQVRYSEINPAAAGPPSSTPEDLGEWELDRIPEVLRGLNRASRSIQLYPLDAKPVADAIDELHTAVRGILSRHRTLSLSAVDGALLANGSRLNTAQYESLAASFADFMVSSALRSITFLSHVDVHEISKFIDVLRSLPETIDEDFWGEFTISAGLEGLFLNEHQYARRQVQSLLLDELPPGLDIEARSARIDAPAGSEVPVLHYLGDDAPDFASQAEPLDASLATAAPELPEDISPDGLQDLVGYGDGAGLRDAIPRFGKELLVSGEDDLFRLLMRKSFAGYELADTDARVDLLKSCGRLLQDVTLALQRKFGELAAESLLSAVAKEPEPRALNELATVLHVLAGTAVQFSDYKAASRIFITLDTRRKELEAGTADNTGTLAKILSRSLDPTVQHLLEEDLKSGDPERQELAARVLGGVGPPGMSMLVEVIKQEKDFRVRQMAASLLSEMGGSAAEQIKTALSLEVTVEQRFRILEVIDIITHDLLAEVAYCLGDGNPKIRRAAFRLAERLHDEGLIPILAPFASSRDPGVVKGAIRSLAHLRSNAAAVTLAEILHTLKNPELIVSCCQALGQIGDSAGIDALKKILAEKRFGFLGYRWDDQVRATAALALRQIADPNAAIVLEPFVDDQDARVRQLARGVRAANPDPDAEIAHTVSS